MHQSVRTVLKVLLSALLGLFSLPMLICGDYLYSFAGFEFTLPVPTMRSHTESQRQASRRIAVEQVHIIALNLWILDLRGLALAAIKVVRFPGQGHSPAAECLRGPRINST